VPRENCVRRFSGRAALGACEDRRQKGHSVIPVLRIVFWVGLLNVAVSCLAQVRDAPNSRRQEALTLEQQGKNAEAEAKWRGYLKSHPSSPEPYAHLGLLEARQEHFKEAAQLYRKALAMGPDLPSVRLNLGLALFKGGDLKAAIAEFEPLLKGQPDNEQLNTLTGMAHYGLAEYGDAVPYLRQAAAQDTRSLPLLLALAHSCLWTKQNQCVLDAYRRILDLDPNSAEADMLAGEALDEMKDNEGSTKMFRAAVEADPKTPNAHFGLGYLLWTQKQYKEAASEFQAELANDPDHMQARLYLADADVQMNRMNDALLLLERVEKQNSAIALVHLDLGIVYTGAGRNEDALRELTAAEKLTPDDVNIHWRLGRLYRAMGDKEKAKAEIDKAGALTKTADDENFKKIANGHPHPAQDPSPEATAPRP
jgi:tetratricopeptide (TPR) repeat protein